MNETQTTMNNSGHEFLFALYVLVGIIVCLGILHIIVFPRVRRLLHHPKSLLDETILDSLIGPVYLTIIIGGVYTAIVQFSYLENHLSVIDMYRTRLFGHEFNLCCGLLQACSCILLPGL